MSYRHSPTQTSRSKSGHGKLNAQVARLADVLSLPDMCGREVWITFPKDARIVAGLLVSACVSGPRLRLWLDMAIVTAPLGTPVTARDSGLTCFEDEFLCGSLDVERANACEGVVVMRSFHGSETCLVVDRHRVVDFNGLPWTSRGLFEGNRPTKPGSLLPPASIDPASIDHIGTRA